MTKHENPPTSESGDEPLSDAALEPVAGGNLPAYRQCSTHSWYGAGNCPNPQPHVYTSAGGDG
jgi:hypothetical protein